MRRCLGFGLFALLAACAADERDGVDTGGLLPTETSDDSNGSEGDTDADDGESLDLPPYDPDGGSGSGCQRVDLLFVVDNSGSMADNQLELIQSFPGFIDGIQGELGEKVDDYHVGVVTTDAYKHNEPGCTALGDLVTQTGGADSSGKPCGPYADGGRHMSHNDDLAATFACAARVGTEGDGVEKHIDGIRGALSPANGCNEGFIREDALLVLVIISDEDDTAAPLNPASAGDPPEWFADVVAAKGGHEQNVSVVSLIGVPPPNTCAQFQAADAKRLQEFTQMFTHGFMGDVCAGDYAPILGEAIGVVDSACDGFVPPG